MVLPLDADAPETPVADARMRTHTQICNDLELHGLVDDDNGMELLVDNRIIALSLPVKLVYEKVWCTRRSAAASTNASAPMVIIYRLQGLDGTLSSPVFGVWCARACARTVKVADT